MLIAQEMTLGFLLYLDEWEAEVDAINGLTSRQKEQMLLSNETLGGLKMTSMYILLLIKFIISFTFSAIKDKSEEHKTIRQ